MCICLVILSAVLLCGSIGENELLVFYGNVYCMRWANQWNPLTFYLGPRDDIYLSSDASSDDDDNDDDEDDKNVSDQPNIHGTSKRSTHLKRKKSVALSSTDDEGDNESRSESPNSVEPFAKRRRSESDGSQTTLQAPLPRFDAFTLGKLKRNPLLVDLDYSAEETKEKRKIQSWLRSDEIQVSRIFAYLLWPNFQLHTM